MTPQRPDNSDDPADWALFYAALGWRVVPCYAPDLLNGEAKCTCRKGAECKDPGKHPRLMGWPEAATTDPATIREWWKRWPNSNVGIVTGAASGLVAIDIDPRNGGDESLSELEELLGPLPATVEALTGGGGRHLLFAHPGGIVPSGNGIWAGIDVKADNGAFIVASTSIHRNGRRYQWELSSMPGEVAVADLPALWIDALRRRGSVANGTETTEGRPSVDSVLSVPLTAWVSADLRNRIESTLPTSPGTRNARTMNLARLLRFHPETRDRPLNQLRPVVQWWYGEACKRTTIAATADDEWDNFVRAHGVARLPLDTDLFKVALAATNGGPFPERAQECYTDPRRWHLAAACRWIQGWVGDGDFSLSVQQVERTFDLPKSNAWSWLRALERDELLLCTWRAPAGPPGSPASRWRWIADDPAKKSAKK